MRAGTVSKYLGLEPVSSMYVTVPVNFILVGFARDGHLNIELTEAEISKWQGRVPAGDFRAHARGSAPTQHVV